MSDHLIVAIVAVISGGFAIPVGFLLDVPVRVHRSQFTVHSRNGRLLASVQSDRACIADGYGRPRPQNSLAPSASQARLLPCPKSRGRSQNRNSLPVPLGEMSRYETEGVLRSRTVAGEPLPIGWSDQLDDHGLEWCQGVERCVARRVDNGFGGSTEYGYRTKGHVHTEIYRVVRYLAA